MMQRDTDEGALPMLAAVVIAAVLIVGGLMAGHETPTNACVSSKELLAEQATMSSTDSAACTLPSTEPASR